MQNIVLTQLTVPELGQLFQDALDKYFSERQVIIASPEADEIGGIDLAVEVTGKAKPTIYAMVSNRQIPHSKRGKQLYFSRKELTEWLRDGKRKTHRELALDAENFSKNNNLKNVTTR